MEENNFSQTVVDAVDAKAEWYDREGLPELLDDYRLLHTCVRTVFDFLSKKSLITPDPYKLDKKISDIKAPDDAPFTENERSLTMGMRLSDYESTLDFLCNYYKFSISNINMATIKKLVALNNAFCWSSLTPNSPKVNTRALAEMVLRARQNLDGLTNSMITDSLSKASVALKNITEQLKELTAFLREFYKGQVRKNVMGNAGYDANAAASSPSEELSQIKKHFASSMGKVPFYNELIDEIVQEDTADNKAELQTAVLKKLDVAKTDAAKKEKQIDTKDMIMGALRVLGAMPPQLTAVHQKLTDNHELLESEHNSFMDKIKRALRKAFNIQEKPQFYQITIADAASDTKRREKINFQQFLTELSTRTRRFTAACVKGAPGYEKILAQPEEKILDFVNAQLAESNKMLKILQGLDDFFKNTAAPENKNKVKGIKMELTSIKNNVVKANQVRAEYQAYVEEAEQMKKLGITDNEF
ncbi:MAG: hypothetical protein IJS09_07305 [Treponema sp.]|nr:hypothetical protein [Treponema sp.]